MESKILVASRDEDCHKNLHEMFKDRQITIHTVSDEADLLLALLDGDYNALIYDLEFSALDSLKMVKILRKLRPKISLVVLSNDSSKELGGKVLQEGIAYYGIKPIYSQTISRVLSNVLS